MGLTDGLADLDFLRALLANQHRFLGSDRLFCFIGIIRFGSFKIVWQRLLGCVNFTLDVDDVFCWYKRKKRLL